MLRNPKFAVVLLSVASAHTSQACLRSRAPQLHTVSARTHYWPPPKVSTPWRSLRAQPPHSVLPGIEHTPPLFPPRGPTEYQPSKLLGTFRQPTRLLLSPRHHSEEDVSFRAAVLYFSFPSPSTSNASCIH